jgi:PAS domain-containing protein/DNA-binding CsgD family transcriptional regulator
MATLDRGASNPAPRALWSHWSPAPTTVALTHAVGPYSELHQFLEEIRLATGADEVLLTLMAGHSAGPQPIAASGRGLSAEAQLRVALSATTEELRCSTRDDDWEWCQLDGADWQVQRVKVDGGFGSCGASLDLLYKPSLLNGTAAARLGGFRPLIECHLRQWLRLRSESRRCDAFRGALDANHLGVLLLDRNAEVKFANLAAVQLLDAGDPLRRSGAGFTATDLHQAMSLQVALSHGIASNAQGTNADRNGRRATVVALRSERSERALMVCVVPLEQPASEPNDVAAVSYLVDFRFDTERQLSPVCRLFGLSPVETRLVCQLTAGRSLQEAATDMRIKVDTARSYLKQIFLKTDTCRQADLVRTMLCSLIPIACGIEPEPLREGGRLPPFKG